MDQREDKESSDMMRLDPGPRRRTAASSTSFCCLITLLVGGLLAFAIVAFLFSFILSNVRRIIYPHSSLLPNASLPEQGSLIRPLVNSGTTFDIVATVWVRAPRAEEREFNVLQAGGDEEAGRAYDSVLSADVKYLLEYPVFSDVVFRGLRMNDKHASTTVNFTFPTARFRDKDYTTGDLRASFVLIPSEPSVLGHLKNFSTIIPDELDDFPARPWPLPNATDGAPISSGHLGPRSLADAAIDAFGGFATLLEVHETASSCVPRNDEDREDAALDSKSVDDEITDLEGIAAKLEPYMHVYAQAHKKHPYVVTRTQLRIMIDENIYNLTAYNQEHKALKSVACGLKDKLPPGPSRNRCTRSFTQGPLRTRLEIAQPGEEESQWAYAPFLHPLRGSSGTLDLIPIPVDRENCTARNMVKANSSEALPFTDAENMTVTWRLSFSGRSAAKMAIADFIMPNLQFHPPHNASVASKKQAHELFELANGVFGHRFYEDAHPRRRLASLVVSTVAGYIAPLFNFHYWYTCSSTTGLSLRGQWLALTTDAFAELLQFTAAISDIGPDDWLVLALYLGLGIVAAIPVLVTSKALARIDGVRLRGWVPYLHRAKATHRERASARLDTQTTWSAVVAGSVILSLFYYVVKPWQLAALGSFDVPTSSEESKGLQNIIDEIFSPGTFAVQCVAEVMQLVMNVRSRTFAGQSRIAVLLVALSRLPTYAMHAGFPSTYSVPSTVSWLDVLRDVLAVTWMWQALTLPVVDQAAEDEAEK